MLVTPAVTSEIFFLQDVRRAFLPHFLSSSLVYNDEINCNIYIWRVVDFWGAADMSTKRGIVPDRNVKFCNVTDPLSATKS